MSRQNNSSKEIVSNALGYINIMSSNMTAISEVWYLVLVIPRYKRQRQKDQKFKAILG